MLKKIRHRYLALKIESNENLTSKEFLDSIWSNIVKIYGEYGASNAGLSLIDYDDEKKMAIIRTIHSSVNMIRTALALITKIKNKEIAIHVIQISGTIKALSRKLDIHT